MMNRVLNRDGARELTYREIEEIRGAQSTGTGCHGTLSHFASGSVDADFECEPVA